MGENDREIGALSARMVAVEKRLQVLETNTDKILSILASEEGARKEREKNEEARRDVIELSWTKVMALAAVISTGIMAAPLIYHAVIK